MGQFSGLLRVKNVLIPTGEIGINKLASGTKGDLIVTNGTTKSALPVGTNGQVLTADSTETTGLKYSTVSGGGDLPWTKEATLSLSASSTIDFTSITASDEYKIVGAIKIVTGTSPIGITMQYNGDSSATYDWRGTDATSNVGQTSIKVADIDNGRTCLIDMHIMGKPPAGQNEIMFHNKCGQQGNRTGAIYGQWGGGAGDVQINRIKLTADTVNSMTGEVALYRRTPAISWSA